jgi:hypothetical protein
VLPRAWHDFFNWFRGFLLFAHSLDQSNLFGKSPASPDEKTVGNGAKGEFSPEQKGTGN